MFLVFAAIGIEVYLNQKKRNEPKKDIEIFEKIKDEESKEFEEITSTDGTLQN